MSRNAEELLLAWESATKENPLVLDGREADIFLDAMKRQNAVISTASRVQIAPRFPEYKSQIDGSIITDRAQHREHLRAHGATEIGTAYDKDVRALKEAALEGKERNFAWGEEIKSSSDGFQRSLYQRLSHEGL